MITVSSAELNVWIAALIWPLTRILGLLAVAPLFGNLNVPMRIKVGLGIMLSLIIAPTVPELPALDPLSLAGLLILAQQLVIGLALGFAMRIVFAAVEFAGEVAGLTMGFGFASFFDPNTHGRSSAINQFLSLLAILLFLALNVHLMMLSTLAETFQILPISSAPFFGGGFQQLASWGGRIFSAGLQLALPVIAALLITNVALGILTRAAPQLNLFAIGFPITLGVGLIVIALSLPYIATPMANFFQEGINMMGRIAAVAGGR
ncbi:flagellar biosynthetic protein FliR [Noviherbaspirillum massiliense]|uniref:flagellar biosynthetic protein FliR n=1 Tax=Noviherbaspirillum massiliense TaxID=1465823 RepID=UPI0002FCF6D1|nr:flagellar biosynthetic protein FliR [Noviherbaspirillum massiliense]